MQPGRASPWDGGQLPASVLVGSGADTVLRDLPAPHLARGETEAWPYKVWMRIQGSAVGLGAQRLAWSSVAVDKL